MQPAASRDAYLSILAANHGDITPNILARTIESTGLSLNDDRRLAPLHDELTQPPPNATLDLEQFCRIMSGDGGLLATAALQGALVIPDFITFRRRLDEIFASVLDDDPVGAPPAPPRNPPGLAVFDAAYPEAHNADYIPALSTAADAFGVSACTINGQQLHLGDADRRFSIQSCCKPLNYALALETYNNQGKRTPNPGGREPATTKAARFRERAQSRKINRFEHLERAEATLGVHDYIDCEPSGQPFNAPSFNDHRMPCNPMINAGALMSAALVSRAGPTDIELEHVQRAWARIAGTTDLPMPDTKTAKGESRTGANNRSIAYKMLSNEAFPAFVKSDEHLENVLDFYFHCCALMMNCQEMATAAATLANRGICPTTGQRVFHPDTVRHTLATMLHCGMYDSSGRFGKIVGLPAKSGVGGAIILVVPGVMGLCTFSPRLDKVGNSLRGLRFIECLLDTYALHILDATDTISKANADPTLSPFNAVVEPSQRVMAAAALGDLAAFLRFECLAPSDDEYLRLLNAADYDRRTPLHLATCENSTDVVRYLLERGVDNSPADRWGATPLAEARRFNLKDAEDILVQAGATDADFHADDPASIEDIRLMQASFPDSEVPHRSNDLEVLELIWAASRSEVDHLRKQAARGARLLVADFDDRTPLHLACANRCHHAVDLITRYFRAVDDRRDHDERHLDLLLSWPDRWGRTPLDELRASPDHDRTPEAQDARERCRAILAGAGALTGEQLHQRARSRAID